MNVRKPLIASLLLIAVMIAFTAWSWNAIPPEARIPVHWDIRSHANRFASKSVGLSFAPALALVMTILFALWPRVEPRRANLASSRAAYTVGWIGVVGLLTAIHIAVVMGARGTSLDITGLTVAAVSILLIGLGNFLGKSRANFFLGVRTPWTLSSDLAWEKSNRLTGRFLVLTGVVTLGALAFAAPAFAIFALIAGSLCASLCGVAVSYIYWKRDPHRHAGDVLE